MESDKRVWWIGAAVLVLVVLATVIGLSMRQPVQPTATATPLAKAGTAPAPLLPPQPKPHEFTSQEMQAFLAAATKAEDIADPLQRCLAYPDPPGSHWTHAAAAAYCQYRYQPIVTLAQVRDLIQHGHAAELDRLLGDALQAQLTQPQAAGRLDRIFYADFEEGSFDERLLIDAWKRASPDSAFAYAASGYSYVQMAYAARGGEYVQDTPQSQFEAMQRLLQQADADLQHALKLNPRITPIYGAMVRAGAFGLGKSYLLDAVHKGLQIDPASLSIYGFYLWAEEPQWYGSVAEMQRIVATSLRRADRNPLLLLNKSEPLAYVANIQQCCGRPTDVANFPNVFDEVAGIDLLGPAGKLAAEHGQADMAMIYLSEAVRFDADDDASRYRLANLLARTNQARPLLEHAQRLLQAVPGNTQALALRSYAHLLLGDRVHAKQDLLAALAKDPDNTQILALLGRLYVYTTHEWDKGWEVADHLIRVRPEMAEGWRLRVSIQLHQPRPGLDDTIHYFLAHFGNDPQQRSATKEMHRILEAEAKGGEKALAPFRG